MPKKINLSGVVGWEITNRLVENLLPKNSTEDVEVIINSYGGDAFEAFAIYNTLKDYPGKVKTVIKGIAASAAGTIYLAGKTKAIYKNSTFMAHPAWSFAIGEGDFLISRGKMLNDVTGIVAEELAVLMEKEKAEVIEELKNEIWLVGWDDIVNSGLADEVIDNEDGDTDIETKDEISMKIVNIQNKMRAEAKADNNLYEKVAASIVGRTVNIQALPVKNKTQEEADMTLKEYLNKYPEAQAEIDTSIKSAVSKELETNLNEDRERSAQILKIAGVNDSVIENITNGITEGEFAIKEVENLKKARAENKSNGVESLEVSAQLPADTAPDGNTKVEGAENATAEQAKEIDVWNKLYKKEGDK